MHTTSHQKVYHNYQGGSPTRRALGSVVIQPRKRFEWANESYRLDGIFCTIHPTIKLAARRGSKGRYSRIWTKCPDCFPITARRHEGWNFYKAKTNAGTIAIALSRQSTRP